LLVHNPLSTTLFPYTTLFRSGLEIREPIPRCRGSTHCPAVTMPKIRSQSLIIDASVARAAGPEEATHPTAKHCRDFLLAVADICHRIVLSDAIEAEWNSHQSGFARRWRRSMFARKKIDRVKVPVDRALRKELAEAATTEKG